MPPINYHLHELEIARDLSNPERIMPPFLPKHQRILDVGCGIGQTLIAADLPSDVEAYGVDVDRKAIDTGQRIVSANIKLLVAAGHNLPFPDSYFDLVFSRVALPYMPIDRTLREMARVLKPGGDLWLALHSGPMTLAWVKDAARHLRFKRVLSCSYALVNGFVFNTVGWQLSIFGRWDTFQTAKNVVYVLRKAGFHGIAVEESSHMTAAAQKPGSEL